MKIVWERFNDDQPMFAQVVPPSKGPGETLQVSNCVAPTQGSTLTNRLIWDGIEPQNEMHNNLKRMLPDNRPDDPRECQTFAGGWLAVAYYPSNVFAGGP